MDPSEFDGLFGALADDLNGLAVRMRQQAFASLATALADIEQRYAPRVAADSQGARLLRRRVAEWRYHVAHEHGMLDECEAALRTIGETGTEDDREADVDFRIAFARLCVEHGALARARSALTAARALLASTPDSPERRLQVAAVEEIERRTAGA